ncbi:MAG: aminoglycoside phosphotransferase family protein [Myxococcota bacterium]
MSTEAIPPEVLAAWTLEDASVVPITHGHINRTYRVECGVGTFVLQRVAPIFGAEIHGDIAVVTQRLAARGVPTPRLIETEEGALYLEHDGVWRLMTFAPGRTHLRVGSPALARSAAELLARFHDALADLDYTFQNKRTGIHDTKRHLRTLSVALSEHSDHVAYDEVAPLAESLVARLDALPDVHGFSARPVHGDPKISNVLFDRSERAHCLVDLDTLGRMSVVLELGDAMRSWCNLANEDGEGAEFSQEIFQASMAGYLGAAGASLPPEERDPIIDGVETIALELASRFAADALNESYFGWDRKRFSRASEHNLARARNQVALADSVRKQRAKLEAVLLSR